MRAGLLGQCVWGGVMTAAASGCLLPDLQRETHDDDFGTSATGGTGGRLSASGSTTSTSRSGVSAASGGVVLDADGTSLEQTSNPSCPDSTEEVEVVATTSTMQKGMSGSVSVVPASGASIPLAKIVVKFCFTISTDITEEALVLSYASATTDVAPHNVVLSTAAVTVEKGEDASSCMVIDIGGVKGAEAFNLKSTGKLSIDWRFDNTIVTGSMLDTTKPQRFTVLKDGSVIGCGDVLSGSTS